MLCRAHAFTSRPRCQQRCGSATASPLRKGSPLSGLEDFIHNAQRRLCTQFEALDGSGASFGVDAWQRDGGAAGSGCTRVLADGLVFEKAAVNVSVLRGTLTRERASAMSQRGRPGVDPAGGQGYEAVALSLVFHSARPALPTFRADIRAFAVDDTEPFYGGGADLTPSYVHEDDASIDGMGAAWRLFVAALSVFHLSEFAFSAAYTRHELGWHSFLVSKPYAAAMLFAACEHFLELRLTPSLKTSSMAPWIEGTGLACVVFGEALRKTGQLTAKHCFTHNIARQRRDGHVLVTSGVYSYVRHPGYLGWFIWAVGTQVLLQNPSQRFFSKRIAYEEALLGDFFGTAFKAYRARTATWIPGIP